MKVKTLLLTFIFVLAAGSTQAQLLKKPTKRAEKAVERKLEQKVEKETDKAMDSVLDGNKKKKPENEETVIKEDKNETNIENGRGPAPNEDEAQSVENTSSKDLKPWSKYNFVPGDKIIFQDDLVGEENGEFPSHWDLVQGNAENASMGEENIINPANRAIIAPLMKESPYLPDVFTIEFNAYFADTPSGWQNYKLRFWPGNSLLQPQTNERYNPISIQNNEATFQVRWEGVIKKYESFEDGIKGNLPTWKHIAIAFNQRSMKVFIDQHRVLNIPNLHLKPQMFSIEANTYNEQIRAVKNMRIAEDLYDQVLADGKFVLEVFYSTLIKRPLNRNL